MRRDASLGRRRCGGGFTLIELMIVIAMLGVWVVNIAGLLPWSWKRHHQIARENEATVELIRLHAHLSRDLDGAAVRRGTGGVELDCPGGRRVEYVPLPGGTGLVRLVRRAAGAPVAERTRFVGAALSVEVPAAPGQPWVVRLAASGQRPYVILTGWLSEEAAR